jgi:hypothetical protein
MQAFVTGVGVLGPGLNGWPETRAVLAGGPWVAADIVIPPPAQLATNERRRAGTPVRLALAVADEAVRMAGIAPDKLRGVFGSGNGEGAILHGLLETLASDAPQVSPTQFHNSVHNAVAGYWAIVAQSRQPVTCLGAHRDTFAATLLKALTEVAAEQEPVLMCVYDVPLPEPLGLKQPTSCSFGCALVLTPDWQQGALAGLQIAWQPAPPSAGADRPNSAALAELSVGNPAARSLRLLQALATSRADRAAFALLDGAVHLQVEPC